MESFGSMVVRAASALKSASFIISVLSIMIGCDRVILKVHHYTKGMLIFNRVRIFFGQEIEKLKPLVRHAYQAIHDFQQKRTSLNENMMREAIKAITPILEVTAK